MYREYRPNARQPIGSVTEIQRVFRENGLPGRVPRTRHFNRVARRRLIRKYGLELLVGVVATIVVLLLFAWVDATAEGTKLRRQHEIETCLARGGIPVVNVDEAGDQVVLCQGGARS